MCTYLLQIWISLKDWGHVQKFVSEALSCQHLDVVYVYRKLESEKVFFYTAMPKQVSQPLKPFLCRLCSLKQKNTTAVGFAQYVQTSPGIPSDP